MTKHGLRRTASQGQRSRGQGAFRWRSASLLSESGSRRFCTGSTFYPPSSMRQCSSRCLERTADMWASFGERISRARFNLSPQLLRAIIEAEIEVSVELVN